MQLWPRSTPESGVIDTLLLRWVVRDFWSVSVQESVGRSLGPAYVPPVMLAIASYESLIGSYELMIEKLSSWFKAFPSMNNFR